MAKKKIILHVYHAYGTPQVIKFDKLKDAIDRAYIEFENNTVYKCKVWNLDLGPIQPNLVNAPGLVFELV